MRGRKSPLSLTLRGLEPLEPRILLSDSTAGYPTGALPPSAADLAWMYQNMIVTEDVGLNWMGLVRVNAARAARGQAPLDPAQLRLAGVNQEVHGRTQAQVDAAGGPAAQSVDWLAEETGALPPAVDNSVLNWFPAIGSQSISDCSAWATTYYTMTYMTARARGWDAKHDSAGNYRFSPKWSYTMVNGGSDGGSDAYSIYSLLISNGAATLADFPYNSNYREWVYKTTASYHNNTKTSAQVWRDAISNRAYQTGSVLNVDTDTGLNQLKTLLTDGYVLNFATYVYAWLPKTVGNDPSDPSDDPYAGQGGYYALGSGAGGHEMTIVGYNDSIWLDVNSNGVVDSGEKGALLIANSWGAGWGNGGYTWLAYDALKATSAVSGWTPVGRQAAFWGNSATWLTARPEPYTPTAVAEFTIQHSQRNMMAMSLSITNGAGQTSTYTPSALYYDGGSYGFDGVSYSSNPSAAPTGIFVLDFSDLAPNLSAVERYTLTNNGPYQDTYADTIYSFKLTDAAGNVLGVCATGPRVGDLPTHTRAYLDYPDTEIRGNVWLDLNGNGVKDAGEIGLANQIVYLDANNDGAFDSFSTTASDNTSAAIPDATSKGHRVTAGTVTSSLTMSGVTGSIADVNVTLNITHGRDSDLKVTLTSPSGTTITLFDGVGGSGQNFTGTTLDDEAATAITSGSAPFTGAFRPATPLSAFDGLDANGVWQLTVSDGAVGFTGTLNSWSLLVSSNEEATWTNSAGDYALTRLASGPFAVRVAVPVGLTVTSPAGGAYSGALADQQVLTGQDFGAYTAPPTIVQPAAASPNPVAGSSSGLSVRADDDGGEQNLVYTWSTVAKPAGAANPTFSVNATNAAKDAVATFSKTGNYTLRVTVADAYGRTVTSSVAVTVNPVLTSIALSPANPSVTATGTCQFTATAIDQFGAAFTPSGGFAWSVQTPGGGSITSAGLYTAPLSPGSATVRAESGAVFRETTVTVLPLPPAAADDTYTTGQGVALSVAAPGVLANDTDAYGLSLTAVNFGNPSHGVLTPNADGSFAYTPDGGYYGPDSFTYMAYDTQAYSNVATVNITVVQDVTPPAILSVEVNGGRATRSVVKSLAMRFSEALAGGLPDGRLTLHNSTDGSDISQADIVLSYDAGTNTAVWTFPTLAGGTLPDGAYVATLDVSGVTDPAGNVLNGGTNYVFSFIRLGGDVNGDNLVDMADYVVWFTDFGASGDGWTQGDCNADGMVDMQDYVIWFGNFGRGYSLAEEPAAPEAGGEIAGGEDLGTVPTQQIPDATVWTTEGAVMPERPAIAAADPPAMPAAPSPFGTPAAAVHAPLVLARTPFAAGASGLAASRMDALPVPEGNAGTAIALDLNTSEPLLAPAPMGGAVSVPARSSQAARPRVGGRTTGSDNGLDNRLESPGLHVGPRNFPWAQTVLGSLDILAALPSPFIDG
ncbi:MAG: Ig-like domain-containing protein [Phycisphaerae bacterium]